MRFCEVTPSVPASPASPATSSTSCTSATPENAGAAQPPPLRPTQCGDNEDEALCGEDIYNDPLPLKE